MKHVFERIAAALTPNTARRALRRAVLEALEDGVLTDEEIAALDAKRRELGLPDDALTSLRATAYAAALRAVTRDQRLSPDEVEELRRVTSHFGVTEQQQLASAEDLAHYRFLLEAEEGRLPEVSVSGLLLGDDEVAHWAEAAQAYEFQRTTKRVTSGGGSSVRIAKGYSVRSSRSVAMTFEEDAMRPVGDGRLVVTSERIVFLSASYAFEAPRAAILEAGAFSGGVSVALKKAKRPVVFRITNTRAAERIQAVIAGFVG